MRESFVIHSEYVDDLPEEYKMQFLSYIYNYGIHEINPKLEGLELTIWNKIKRRIDSDVEQWEMTKNARSSAGKKHKGNQYTKNDSEMEQNGTKWNSVPFVPNEWDSVEQNGTNGTVSVYVNDIVSVYDNVSVSENVNEHGLVNVGGQLPSRFTPNQTEYSKILFNIFKEANLPCAKENEISFLMGDFANSMRYLHKTSEYAHLHSDDVIGAVKNYVQIYQDKDCYVTQKMNFLQLVKSKLFYNLLPANFERENFLNYKTADSKQKAIIPEQEYKELCPKCGTVNLIWNNSGEKYSCKHCGAIMTYEEARNGA